MNENNELEFKREYTENLKKEVIALVNSDGGKILIGVDDDGNIIGIDNLDETMTKVTNSLTDNICPDVMPFIKIKIKNIESKNMIEINIEQGDNKPYYLKSKGLKPSGVFVRKGSSSQSVSEEGIRQMILHNSGYRYENCRCFNQNLTFYTFIDEMKKRSIEIGKVQMKNLNLIGNDDLYTNLGLLLSDQCEHTIKVSIFQGNNKLTFRDRKEFTGSILKQLNDALEYIVKYNKLKATFEGLYRIDKYDYPIEAIREALLNCIVHRDYSFSASTIINIFDDRMEFLSLGGLVNGLTIEAIKHGFSQSRNSDLANIFYGMRLIEGFGTGVEKIINLYKNEYLSPTFTDFNGVFKVVIPNRNEINGEINQVNERYVEYCINPKKDVENKIIEFIKDRGKVQRKDIQELLDLKQTRTYEILKDLCNRKIIKASNKGKNTYYELYD